MDPTFVGVRSARPSFRVRSVILIVLALVIAAPATTLARSSGLVPADPTLAPGLRADLASDATSSAPDADRTSPFGAVAARGLELLGPKLAGGKHAPASGGGYAGRNHVWSSFLGLDRPVAWFPCSRSQPPGMAVYRWGCAGRNNVYLFAHAGGPFQRLHDLYVRGGLRRGLTVTYADASGRTATYAVVWWKVVLPTNGDFAFAAQAQPSLTLQTCVGANDRYRLVVRLVRRH